VTAAQKARAPLKEGDYVLATKYHDGDPGDHFCVGFYRGTLAEFGKPDRHLVADNDGIPFRANGFRRVKKISARRGAWLVERMSDIETFSRSVWWWSRRPMGREE